MNQKQGANIQTYRQKGRYEHIMIKFQKHSDTKEILIVTSDSPPKHFPKTTQTGNNFAYLVQMSDTGQMEVQFVRLRE